MNDLFAGHKMGHDGVWVILFFSQDMIAGVVQGQILFIWRWEDRWVFMGHTGN